MAEKEVQCNADKTHILTLGTTERLRMPGNSVIVAMDGIVLEENPDKSEKLLGSLIYMILFAFKIVTTK